MSTHALDAPGGQTYLPIASPQTVSKTHTALQPHGYIDSVDAMATLRSPAVLLFVHASNTPFLPRIHILEVGWAYLFRLLAL